MRSLTSLHESRACSPQNFWSPVQNDFCNKIGQEPIFACRLPRGTQAPYDAKLAGKTLALSKPSVSQPLEYKL
jgi:hypothetical protein